jgi:hypothetical protein
MLNGRHYRDEGPDTVGVALMAAGLAEKSAIKAAEMHIIACRKCMQEVLAMAEVAETIIKQPAQEAAVKDVRWQRIEGFINLWNGKRAVLRFGTLVLTVDRMPKAEGISAILRSENKQSFKIVSDKLNAIKASHGEARVPILADLTTLKILVKETVMGSLDLPDILK